jgi:hypothetical protein
MATGIQYMLIFSGIAAVYMGTEQLVKHRSQLDPVVSEQATIAAGCAWGQDIGTIIGQNFSTARPLEIGFPVLFEDTRRVAVSKDGKCTVGPKGISYVMKMDGWGAANDYHGYTDVLIGSGKQADGSQDFMAATVHAAVDNPASFK